MTNVISMKVAYRVKTNDNLYLQAQFNNANSLYELGTTNSANTATLFYFEDTNKSSLNATVKPAFHTVMYFFDGNVRYYLTPFSAIHPSLSDYNITDEKNTVLYFTNSRTTKLHYAKVRFWPFETHGALERFEDDKNDILLTTNVYLTFVNPIKGLSGSLVGLAYGRQSHLESEWTPFTFERV